MSEEWSNFVNDTRTICKYGAKCYQKNPEHHKNYKHPPQVHQNKMHKEKHTKKRVEPYSKNKRPQMKELQKDDSTESKNNIDAAILKPDHENQISEDLELNNEKIKSIDKDTFFIELNENSIYHDKTDDNKVYKDIFHVEMPPDFFKFYEYLSKEDSSQQILASVNLQLIGPFDLLMGKLPVLDDKDLYLIHWRYFFNPPEFQAVLRKKKGNSQFHIGYYRDDPEGMPAFIANSDSEKDCQINPIADNIFGAVYSYLQNEKKTSPFLAMPCQKLMDKVKKWANELNFSLDEYDMKKRTTKTVAKTLHGAGISVPYNKKTQLGYRPLVESNANLKKIFEKLRSSKSQSEKDEILSQIQPVITYASIAVDECDFGTGLEIGIDLFCSGIKELEASALASLSSAYSLLNREAFSKIAEVHIKHRRRGPNMSVFK